MSDKSYVGMGYYVCPVCCTRHSPEVLINTRMKDTLTSDETLAWAMCPEHKKLHDEGYVALIECTNQPSSMNDAQRTGQIAHVRSSVWPQIFDASLPPKLLAFVEPAVMTALKKMQAEEEP